MSPYHLRIRSALWPVFGALFLLGGLYLVSIPVYLLFHSLIEIFAIVISCAVFTLTWNTRRFLDNDYLLVAGIALLAAAVLNVVHLLSYKGMGVFGGGDANLPTQLWIAQRYLLSISLPAALSSRWSRGRSCGRSSLELCQTCLHLLCGRLRPS